MFGLLSAGVSLAGLGMSAIQAVQANRQMKQAQAKSNAALQGYKNVTEQNAYAGLQAPDISSLQYDRTQRAVSQGVDALSQTGAEGAIGGVANLVQAGQEANLQAAQDQAQANYNRDTLKAEGQYGINQRKAEADREAYAFELGQANDQFNTASANRAGAIEGMLGSLGSAIGLASQDFDPATGMYKYKKNKTSEVSSNAPSANYNGSVTGDYGQQVNTSGLTNLTGGWHQ